MKNNIVIVSDDDTTAKEIASKLVFLRQGDSVNVVDYAGALSSYQFDFVDTVLILEAFSKERTTDVITSLKRFEHLNIFLIAFSDEPDFILNCYEAGIDDFCFNNSSGEEIVIRIVKLLKQNNLKRNLSRAYKILEQLKVIDGYTGFYSYNYAKLVIENCLDYEMLQNGAFIALKLSENNNLASDKLTNILKLSIRQGDIVTLGKENVFYLFLPGVDLNGAISFVNKIQVNSGENLRIFAGITELSKTFSQMEHEALQVLSEAISTGAQYVIYEKKEFPVDEWLLNCDDEFKNYKLFKQIYNKKSEKVIKPVFYRLQKDWEDRLPGTSVEQYVNENESVFELSNKKQSSRLKIIYSGFAKAKIQIIHDGLDSPENEEMSVSVAKLTQNQLNNIVENFILDFKNQGDYVKY